MRTHIRATACGKATAVVAAVVLLYLLLPATQLSAQTGRPRVTASTAWVAAIAEAAGAEVLRVLAPIELRHPAEYDFRPSDVRHAVDADWLVWAGYEGFMRNLLQAVEFPAERVLRVHTNNSPPVLREVVGGLAADLGTEAAFIRWQAELDALAREIEANAVAAGVDQIRLAVHEHHRVVAEWLGYNIVATFGPGELTPTALRQVLAEEPQLIIDNWHMPSGEVLQGDGREYHALINFPGRAGTESLLDVLRFNAVRLGILSEP